MGGKFLRQYYHALTSGVGLLAILILAIPLVQEDVFLATIFALLSIEFLHAGRSNYKRLRKIKTTPVELVNSVSGGRVQITGTVHTSSSPVQPIIKTYGTPVYCRWRLQEWERVWRFGPKRWSTIISGTSADTLVLEDATGKIDVDLSGVNDATITQDSHVSSVQYAKDQPLDEGHSKRIKQSLDGSWRFMLIEKDYQDRRIVQEVISVGSECSVLGTAKKHSKESSSENEAVLQRDCEEDLFVLSDSDTISVQKLKQRSIVGICGGIFLATASVYLYYINLLQGLFGL